jgi:hypothetical protein
MRKARAQHKIKFGPFRTSHFREQGHAGFRRAFYSYLDQQVIPYLEGDIVRIDGRVYSHYDRPQFNDLAEVKHRYYYELSFHSGAGTEQAEGEVDYDPAKNTWAPSRLKPPRVQTLSAKLRGKQSRDLEHQISIEARHHQPVRPAKCPRCASKRVAEIIYGLVKIDEGLEANLKAGKTRLGGCFVSDDNPQWCCAACGHYWGLTARALAKREILKRAPGEQR